MVLRALEGSLGGDEILDIEHLWALLRKFGSANDIPLI